MDKSTTQMNNQKAMPALGAAHCSAYRMLKEGEIIRESDEFLGDGGVWIKTICAGETAPNPNYTSHRQYRRIDTPNSAVSCHSDDSTKSNTI